MKQTFFIASMIATIFANGESMKLVQKNTGRVIVEFKDSAIQFYSRFLESALREEGVLIPPIMRQEFEGKEVVYMDDPLFEKAFVEVYWPLYMATADSQYEWQK